VLDQEKMPEQPEQIADGRQSKDQKSTGRRKGIYALLLLLILAAGAGGFWWYEYNQAMDQTTKYWFDKMAKDGSLDEQSPEDLQAMLDSMIEEGMFNVSINARVVFEDGTGEGTIGIENIPQNRYYCRVILKRDDNGSILYESKGIKPGQYIDKIKLKNRLEAGQYACTAVFVATDPKSLKDVGQVEVAIQIVVLK